MGEAPFFGVFGMDFEGLVRKQIFHSGAASGLGAGVVSFEAPTSGEPDGKLLVDDFRRIAVTDDGEFAASVFEFFLVESRGAGVVFFGNGPLVFAVLDAVPVESVVNRAEAAEFVEDVFGTIVFEAGCAEAFGDLADDPPVGLGFANGRDGSAEALDAALCIGLDTISFAPCRGGKNDVG